jgi:hypothetical protein
VIPVQKFHPHFALELGNALRDSRLGGVKSLSCPAVSIDLKSSIGALPEKRLSWTDK